MKKAVLLLLAVAGCTYWPVLVPDSNASRVGDKVAFTEAAGLRVWVNGDAWTSDPLDLSDVLTPVHMSLENTSSRRIRIAYQQLSLVGDSGMRYAALSPLTADPQLPVSRAEPPAAAELRVVMGYRAAPMRIAPRYHHHHFYVAPHYGWYYPGTPLWTSPWPYTYYATGPYIWPRSLPTDDMMAEALPEGVLEPGGRVAGFAYFQSVGHREERVRLDFKLVDAETGEKLGEAIIPLRVHLR